MNDKLRELIREIISKGNLNQNLVMLEYEVDNEYEVDDDSRPKVLERLSLVYEVTTMKEGFD